MISINDYNFSGKRALIRVDFNVPFDKDFNVTDDTRIRAALPTIQKVIKDGGKAILMSHLGRPKNGPEEKYSMNHVKAKLEELLGKSVHMASNCVGDEVKAQADNLSKGEVLLLENLRFHKEEQAGDEFFSGQLAELGDVYVNDAFGTAHREHASTAVIARFFPDTKMFGYVMEGEIKNIDRVLHGAKSPVTAIIGGAKVSSKITIIQNLMEVADNLLIGGGMAYTFIRAMKGKIGNSLVEDDKLDTALNVMALAKKTNTNLVLPTDTLCADEFSEEANTRVFPTNDIQDGWMGLDIGPATTVNYMKIIRESRTILWNGPMGVFEMEKFATGTKKVAKTLADVTLAGSTFTLVGGGDSVAAVNKYGLAEKVSYVSTGGGAMLEYLEGKVLPGIAAIKGA
ncbi:MAG: phosphoglycerate kinase [Flavobacteriales bacterium]